MASLMDLIKDNAEQTVDDEAGCQNDEEEETCLQESQKVSSSEGFYTNDDGTVLLHIYCIHFQ
jgi:hypothetical protein